MKHQIYSHWGRINFVPNGREVEISDQWSGISLARRVRSADFDANGVEVRKWGTSGVKFQNEKYTLLLAEGLQIWVAVLFLRRFYDIIKLIETS